MENWTDYAACRGMDTNIWFPIGAPGSEGYDRDAERARDVCRTCPAMIDCLFWALDHPDQALGVWGGMDEHERAALLRALPRVPAA